jgi:hypothetical protein
MLVEGSLDLQIEECWGEESVEVADPAGWQEQEVEVGRLESPYYPLE